MQIFDMWNILGCWGGVCVCVDLFVWVNCFNSVLSSKSSISYLGKKKKKGIMNEAEHICISSDKV